MPSSPRPRALLAVASVAVALAAADTYVVVLALQEMMAGVGLGVEALARATPIVSGFLLGYVAALAPAGRLADLTSRSRVLIGCLALFVIGSAVTALAVELPVLVAGRVLQGIGGGGLVPATLALVADLWPPGRRGTPLGVVGAVQEVGSVVGPVLGAVVLSVAGWRAVFWANALAGAVLAAALLVLGRGLRAPRTQPPPPRWSRLLTPVAGTASLVLLGLALWAPARLTQDVVLGEPFVPYAGHTSRLVTQIGLWAALAGAVALLASVPLWWPLARRVDLPGAALLTLALGALVLTFATAQPEQEVLGPAGWRLLPVATLAAAGFVLRQRTAAVPLVARGLVRGPVVPALAGSLLIGVALVAVVVDVPVLARLTVTDDQTTAALVLVRFLVAVPVGALVGGRLLRSAGAGPVAAAGAALAATGLVAMSRWTGSELVSPAGTVVLAAVGLGIGLTIAPVNDAALASARQDDHGTVVSLVVVARTVGMVVGLGALTAAGLHRFYARVRAQPDPTAAQVREAAVVQVQTVLLGAAVAAALAAVVLLLLGRRSTGVAG